MHGTLPSISLELIVRKACGDEESGRGEVVGSRRDASSGGGGARQLMIDYTTGTTIATTEKKLDVEKRGVCAGARRGTHETFHVRRASFPTFTTTHALSFLRVSRPSFAKPHCPLFSGLRGGYVFFFALFFTSVERKIQKKTKIRKKKTTRLLACNCFPNPTLHSGADPASLSRWRCVLRNSRR